MFSKNRGAAIISSQFPFVKAFFDPVQWIAGAFNALLQRQPATRELLAQHAGRTFHIRVSAITVALTISHDGSLSVADSRVVPDVTLRVDAARLAQSGWKPGDEWPEVPGLLHVTGDAAMAQTLLTLARHWRPELEDLLAEKIGDIPATQLVRGAKALFRGAVQASGNLTQNVVEYLSYETKALTPHVVMQTLKTQNSQHQIHLDDMDRRMTSLSMRIQALEQGSRRVDNGDNGDAA